MLIPLYSNSFRTALTFPVDCESTNNFKVTREALEYAYEIAQLDNIKVKGCL